MSKLPEVAYFKVIREIAAANGRELNPDEYGNFLRPDSYTPNYEFFVPEIVCWEHRNPRLDWSVRYNKMDQHLTPEDLKAYTCLDCGKLDPVSFKKCPGCSGAFYCLFRHPYQARGNHYCWNCLEAGEVDELNDYWSRFSKVAPPDGLNPPVVTLESKQAGDDAFWNNLQDLLNS